MNKSGDMTLPWGTPILVEVHGDTKLLTKFLDFRPDRKLCTYRSIRPIMLASISL